MGWTQEQTAAQDLALTGDGRHPTQQAVSDALRRIGWSQVVEPALEHIRELLSRSRLEKQAI